ncbi:hypothetical protein [Methanocalculus taiwanensis]|nr:hypothetical protein [Methanocalculus taiwanensis]
MLILFLLKPLQSVVFMDRDDTIRLRVVRGFYSQSKLPIKLPGV